MPETSGAAAGGDLTLLGLPVQVGTMLLQLVVFLLLVYLLQRYAWPHVARALEERRERIRADLEEAARQRAEAQALIEEQRRLLDEARAKAEEILRRSERIAEEERERMLEEARQAVEKIRADAQADIVRAKEEAILALRREAVELSVSIAEKILAREVEAKGDRAYLEKLLEEVSR
ncbi:MAG: F0F1 ATP synthase subunit B [Brockia lithotrophica]|nr:F0F1 ATP synthase subunit B [Brockia lithotrophica]